MSYDRKMKDLMARLVSMSPEPPPHPEEETMIARHEAKKERRPALVFVGAVALVALLAVPLLLFTGGEDPVAVPSSTTTSTTPVTSTTAATATSSTAGDTTTTDGATATTQAVLPVWSRPIFLYMTPENSFSGSPALVPVWIELTPVNPNAEFTEALTAMGDDLPGAFENAVPADVVIMGTQLEDGIWTVEMNGAFLDGAGGHLADVTMLNQLVYTISDGTTADQVRFTVNGEPVEAFGSEGLVLTDPVTRETFIDELAPIFLTQPIMETENVWVVAGRANTFEAALTVRVLDGSGTVVHEEPAMATCGSGCWGEFEIGIDTDLIVPGESAVQLLTYSPEDGEPSNVITIPIPADGVWQLTLDG